MAYRSAIGIEISENVVVIAQIQNQNEDLFVSHYKMVPIPAQSVANGVISDPTLLADHISTVLQDNDFFGDDVVVSLTDSSYFKAIEKMPILKTSELLMDLEMKVSSHRLFSQDDFQLGYQLFREPVVDKVEKSYQSVLYAALSQDTVDSIQQFTDNLGMNLVAIDLSPLAAVRSMLWEQDELSEAPFLVMYSHRNFLDCYIIWDNAIIFTQSLRLDLEAFSEDPTYVETIESRLKHFLFAYSDMYPHFEPVSLCLYASRLDQGDFIMESLSQAFTTIQFVDYQPSQNIKFDTQILSGQENELVDYLVPIGLGLKYFEKYNQTLSLTKIQKRLAPILKKKEFGVALAIFIGIFLVFKGIQLFVGHYVATVDDKVAATKKSIASLQSGEFLTRQKQLQKYQTQIQDLGEVRSEKYSQKALLSQVISVLPADVTFQSFSVTQQGGIRIMAQALYQESIFNFFDALKKTYKKVEISDIRTQVLDNGSSENKFQLTMEKS